MKDHDHPFDHSDDSLLQYREKWQRPTQKPLEPLSPDLLLQAPVAIAIFRGPELVCELANDAYLPLVDKTREQFVGRPLFESLPETRAVLEPFVQQLLRTGEPFPAREFEIVLHRHGKDEVCYFDSVWEPLREPDGTVGGMMVVAHEVTDQVLSRRAIEEKEEQLRVALDGGGLGVYDYYPQTERLLWSDRTLELFGLKPGTVGSRALFLDAIHPDDRARTNEAVVAALQDPSNGHYENEYRVIGINDGKLRWLRSKGRVTFDANGQPIRLNGVIQDITDQRNALIELAYQKTLLETVTQNMTLGLFLMDDRQRCIYMNEAAEAITGFRLDEVGEKPLHDYVHHQHPDGSHFPIEDCPIDRALPEKKREQGEEVFVHKDGHFYPVAFTASPIEVDGRGTGTVIEVRSTAAEKERERVLRESEERYRRLAEELEEKVRQRTQALEQANRQLERSNKELGEFAYIASHDLRAPLNNLRRYAERLEKRLGGTLDDDGQLYLERMQESANRMSQLISDLLDFATQAQAQLVTEPVDLHRVIDKVRRNLELAIEQHGATVTVHGQLPVIDGMESQLEQYFQNIIGNALKFMRPDVPPVITITATTNVDPAAYPTPPVDRATRYCAITVADNGIGFDPEYAERIFRLFQRLHGRGDYEGTGIGLAICKKIAENHGGTVVAEGKEGEGARFTLVVPARQER